MTVVNKDIPSKRNTLGQFLTPPEVAEFCVSRIETDADLIIEPSCGEGVFLDPLQRKFPDRQVIGLELDEDLRTLYTGEVPTYHKNFYDYGFNWLYGTQKIAFVGNPPYRSPAYSLTSHPSYVRTLRKKFGVDGVREEAVLFILQSFFIAEMWHVPCEAHYILPRAIFQNNSKVFTKFASFLNANFGIREVYDLGNDFDSVSRNLVLVSMTSGPKSETITLNGNHVKTEEWLCGGKGIIPFQKIFKKTYLGSVPCESLFLACKDEPKEHFRDRLLRLFGKEKQLIGDEILDHLSFNGEPHLMALKKKDPVKVKSVSGYVEEVKSLPGFSLDLFADLNNYKPIKHRHESRWYFRHDFLKRGKFVYQLNPNPCPSFTFPGNPSSSSKDYFGHVEYDINRNSGPGAQRCVPIDGVEENLTDWFRNYWSENTKLPYKNVLDYLQWIGRSEWYRQAKKANERFYFGIPEKFNTAFVDELSKE